MAGLKVTLGWLLGITSAWLIISGAALVVRTLGPIQGTEFSMLVTLVHLVASATVWLGFFALWKLIPDAKLVVEKIDA